jgi:hypothetical protein
MAVAVAVGSLQNTLSQDKAVHDRLRSAQGNWDGLGRLANKDGAILIADGAYHRLPLLAGLASGLTGREEQDLTLARGGETVWTHLRPGLLQAYTKGPLRAVLERATTLESLFTEQDGLDALPTIDSAAKEALANPTRAQAVLVKAAEALGKPLRGQDAGSAFLTTFLPLETPEKTAPTPQER